MQDEEACPELGGLPHAWVSSHEDDPTMGCSACGMVRERHQSWLDRVKAWISSLFRRGS